MSDIKRLNIEKIVQNFGIDPIGEDFFFKSESPQPFAEAEPYRTETYGIGLVLAGETNLRADLNDYEVNSPSIIAMGPEIIRQWFDHGKTIKTINVFFKEQFILPYLSDILFLRKLEYFGKSGIHNFPVSEDQLHNLKGIFDTIERKYNSGYKLKYSIIRSYLQALLYEIEEIYLEQYKYEIHQLSQSQLLVRKFKDLLAKNFYQQRSVQFYADNLFVNAKHLSQTLKDETGKTASELINEMVMLEAKVLLQDDNMTINQVAIQLNFADASFFGKFFKRHTGMNPRQYRSER